MADALGYDAPGEAGEAHWNEEAKALIAGLILHIVCQEPAGTRTLATLRDRLTPAPHAFAAQLEALQAQGGLTARAAHRPLGPSHREAPALHSAAHPHTHFLASPHTTSAPGHTGFPLPHVQAPHPTA